MSGSKIPNWPCAPPPNSHGTEASLASSFLLNLGRRGKVNLAGNGLMTGCGKLSVMETSLEDAISNIRMG